MSDTKMLRITEMFEDEKTIKLKVDGRLVGTCISLLKQECLKNAKNKQKTVLLDLSGVSYIDSNGVKMLESIKDDNLRIINCPMFIEALLKDLISINKGD